MVQIVYIVHSTPSLSESCLTVRYHSLFLDLSLHLFLCLAELFRSSFLLCFSHPFCKGGKLHPLSSLPGIPLLSILQPVSLLFLLSHTFIVHSALRPSPMPYLFFTFLICLSTSSTVTSVPSTAVCFFFISVSAFPSSYLPSNSFMKYSSHSCIVISLLTNPFSFSLGLCISISPRPRFLPYGFYGTFRSAVFQFLFLCLSLLQVVRRGSGALSPTTHAHSTSHSQTYTTTFIHPWAPFPTGLEPVLTSR
jgi:hypothetical protein